MGKELEELKRLAYENACCRCQYYIDNKCINKGECVWKTIEKELKAFEIIISKKTNIAMLFWYFKYKPNYEKYVEAFNELSNDYNEEMLTQEEYELLKEVLL